MSAVPTDWKIMDIMENPTKKNRVLEWGELTKLLGPVVFSFSTS